MVLLTVSFTTGDTELVGIKESFIHLSLYNFILFGPEPAKWCPDILHTK